MLFFTFSLSVHGETLLLGDFTGYAPHANLLKEKIKDKLVTSTTLEVLDRSTFNVTRQEAMITASGLAQTDTSAVNYKVGKYLLSAQLLPQPQGGLHASFTMTDIQTSAIVYTKLIPYDDIYYLDQVVRVLMADIQVFFKDKLGQDIARPGAATTITSPAATATAAPSAKEKLADSLYQVTEKVWMDLGATAYDWEVYFESQRPFKYWLADHTFNPSTAALVAAVPGWSGYNYTRQWGIGMFWSMAELIILGYGMVRHDNMLQSGLILSTLVPITVFDIMLSRRSAEKNTAVSRAISGYYKDHPFPFNFMKEAP
jgi:hypothetical protein